MDPSTEGLYPTALQAQLDEIDTQIVDLAQITGESIEILEEKKRQIRKEADPNSSEADTETRLSANDLDAVIGELDREISRIQAEHDATVIDLQQQKTCLEKRQASIEKLDLLTSILTYKIFDTQYEYRQDMDEKLRLKEELTQKSDMSENQKALETAELDKLMADCKNTYESTIASLDGQRLELQREIATKIKNIDLTLHLLAKQRDAIIADLETKRAEASPSFDEEINRRIYELNKMLERDTQNLAYNQNKDLKEVTEEERLAALLATRGLKATKSGNFLTTSGTRITKSEASCLGLLEGLDLEAWSVFQEKDVEKTPETLSTITDDTATETSESEMTSDDVEYLKVSLGTPLTLAIAEITAKQPRDPIHYLAHWLFKYRYNQELDLNKKREIQELVAERDRLEKEKLHAIYEEEARAAVVNMVIRAEEEAIRRELERIAREAAMYEDEEGFDAEARDTLGAYDGPTTGQRI